MSECRCCVDFTSKGDAKRAAEELGLFGNVSVTVFLQRAFYFYKHRGNAGWTLRLLPGAYQAPDQPSRPRPEHHQTKDISVSLDLAVRELEQDSKCPDKLCKRVYS
jgi:hypothetical protein